MSLTLNKDYSHSLRMAKPIFLGRKVIHPPPGALGDITVVEPQTIPPVNTNIQFDVLPQFKLSEHPGLAALDIRTVPETFNWRENGGAKSSILSKPGNQMLCGSCWAISAAGIVADNHVVAGTVDWDPNLSTTWCLACYPQLKCKGGNPAKLYEAISESGVVTNHCVDYSWCSENPLCNGTATKHFKAESVELSNLIPNCGCYDSKVPHYLYFIDSPKFVSLGNGGLTNDNFTDTIKKHIYYNGPVQGGFVVFRNFMHGGFTKVNGGVYLENGVYDDGNTHFDNNQATAANYVGSHAIAIIGWGVQKGVVVDNNGTKKDVPYWYCRNSWTEKWGDGGYFKMAMYPYNKTSQFDRLVVLNTPTGAIQSGGMIMMNASRPPVLKTLPQIEQLYLSLKKSQPDDFYSVEEKKKSIKPLISLQVKHGLKYVLFAGLALAFLIFCFFLFVGIKRYMSKPSKPGKSARSATSTQSTQSRSVRKHSNFA